MKWLRDALIKTIGSIRKARFAISIFVVPLFVIFVLVFAIENTVSQVNATRFETCFQFITGNWPTGAINHKGPLFAGGVTFRFALLYGAATGLIKIWRDLVAWHAEELVMKYSELLRDRDLSIENEVRRILTSVPHAQRAKLADDIHKAFEDGERRFYNQHLPALAGSKDAAEEIVRKLDRTIS